MEESFGFKYRHYRSKSGFKYEVSRYFIIKSIEIAEETRDSRFYCDWYKLHKLMYYGQVAMLCKFDDNLFVGTITAHDCGPMIEGIGSVSIKYGFDPITKVSHNDLYVMKYYDLLFNEEQVRVMNSVIECYGYLNKDEIIDLARNDRLWREVYYLDTNGTIKHPIITNEKIIAYYRTVLPMKYSLNNESTKILKY